MTEQQVRMLICLNIDNFPGRFLNNATKEQLDNMVNSWLAVLQDLPGEVVLQAYHRALTYCEFPVTVANIFKELRKQQQNTLPNVEQLWQKLCKAADYCYYESTGFEYDMDGSQRAKAQASYDKLPDACRAFIGSLARAIDFGKMNNVRREDMHFGRFRRFVEDYQAKQLDDIGSAMQLGADAALMLTEK